MNPRLIVIDGKTYRSIEEMPPDVREKYELAMTLLGDTEAVPPPSAWESRNIHADQNQGAEGDRMVNSVTIIMDGKEFDGIEDLPPEARARYQEAVSQLDANGNGLPDLVEGMLDLTPAPRDISTGLKDENPRRSAPLPVSPTISPDTSSGWMLSLAVLFILLLCTLAAASVWYFFLR